MGPSFSTRLCARKLTVSDTLKIDFRVLKNALHAWGAVGSIWNLTLQNKRQSYIHLLRKYVFFYARDCLYLPGKEVRTYSRWDQFDGFRYYIHLGDQNWSFKNSTLIHLFWNLKILYHSLRSTWRLYHFIWDLWAKLGFQKYILYPPFVKSREPVLS